MAIDFLTAIRLPEVATLPSASANTGVMIRQNNRLWFSNGTTWRDLGPIVVEGAQKITVGTVAPSSPATGDIWIDTN
jgi:hypothetical protein